MIRKWDIKDEQAQRRCVDEVLTRFEEQDGSPFGMLAAQEIIDIVAEYVGPAAYNAGIDDAQSSLQSKLSDLDIELNILKITP